MSRDKVGNDAGWHLAFFTEPPGEQRLALSIGAGDYHADITATLPSGLEGGTYTFVIEGITNAHYRSLHEIWSAQPRRPLYVDLYLYWRDLDGVFGRLASIAGLADTVDRVAGTPSVDKRVARLAVTRLSRRTGTRRYEAVIEAHERVFARLGRRLARPVPAAATAVEAAALVAEELDVPVARHPFQRVPSDGVPVFESTAGRKGTAVLAGLVPALEAESRRTGLSMFVIRDGVLHVGAGRPIPLAGEPEPLDDAGGLVHVETAAQSTADQADADGPAVPSPVHLHYLLTLKGRADLRPGDMVSFADPFSDGLGNLVDPASALNATTTPSSFGEAFAGLGRSLLGSASALVGGAATMVVTSVSHRLSRTSGFVSTVAGIGVQPGSEWDPVSPTTSAFAPSTAPPAATAHEEVAGAIHDFVKAVQPEGMTVGEIRAAHPTGTAEPPGQTVDVWIGLIGEDGKPHRARRLAVDRDRRSRRSGVPYATPFAWGRSGLVLPRYPGTRVLLANMGDGDAVDVGAVWESGRGPDARPGDWWLILPAAVDPSARQTAADDVRPQEPSGSATNDLIDADGRRTIEVGRLTVRVTPSSLRPPGERPSAPSSDAEQVTIEHESGSRIVIRDDGDIVIESARDLRLATARTMTLEADDVVVKVKNRMDVGDR
jgi:hypothetical protein